MVVKFRNTIFPPPSQLSLHRQAALSSNSNGTQSVYIAEKTPKSSLYCEMSMAPSYSGHTNAPISPYRAITFFVVGHDIFRLIAFSTANNVEGERER
jgi:hypothetical protein